MDYKKVTAVIVLFLLSPLTFSLSVDIFIFPQERIVALKSYSEIYNFNFIFSLMLLIKINQMKKETQNFF